MCHYELVSSYCIPQVYFLLQYTVRMTIKSISRMQYTCALERQRVFVRTERARMAVRGLSLSRYRQCRSWSSQGSSDNVMFTPDSATTSSLQFCR